MCSLNDCLLVQEDLDRMSVWCAENVLELNVSKCKVMRFFRCKEPVLFNYALNGVVLDSVSSIRCYI